MGAFQLVRLGAVVSPGIHVTAAFKHTVLPLSAVTHHPSASVTPQNPSCRQERVVMPRPSSRDHQDGSQRLEEGNGAASLAK